MILKKKRKFQIDYEKIFIPFDTLNKISKIIKSCSISNAYYFSN